jgi:general secretion pathway protein J
VSLHYLPQSATQQSHAKPKARHGFTLLEVLIALVIMAVIALLSWQGLANVFRLSDRIRLVDDTTAEWRAMLGQLEIDLQRVPVQRKSLGPNPTGQIEPISSDSTGITLVIADQQGQEPARWVQVRWVLSNGNLARIASQQQGVSNTATGLPKEQTIVGPALRALRIRLWTEATGWTNTLNFGEPVSTETPQATSTENLLVPVLLDSFTSVTPPPDAPVYNSPTGLEIRIWLPDGRIYTRIFRIGTTS